MIDTNLIISGDGKVLLSVTNKSINSVNIPDSVTSVGDKAFYNCSSLQAIVIPDSVTSIGNEAFISCDSLQSIQIPNSVTDIGKSAFEYTGLTSVVLPEGIKSIKMGTFANCRNLRHVQLPKTLRTIEQGARWIWFTCNNHSRRGYRNWNGGIFQFKNSAGHHSKYHKKDRRPSGQFCW